MINIQTSTPIIGIYKITSPSGKVYIGQSTNIENRWVRYKKYHSSYKSQRKLYNSIQKYGWESHKFEILEECNIDFLFIREAYYKQQFIDINGWDKAMFFEIWDIGSSGNRSEIIKKKISESNKGKSKPKPKNYGLKLSKILKGHKKKSTINFLGTKNRNNIDKNKAVIQYDKNNIPIKEWSSIKEAETTFNHPKADNIGACCRNKQKTAYGFIWKYKN